MENDPQEVSCILPRVTPGAGWGRRVEARSPDPTAWPSQLLAGPCASHSQPGVAGPS